MPDHPPDHIGWALHRAFQVWRGEFTTAMITAGHGWFGQARANLMQHIGPNGVRQGDLVARAGLTKQAVQQFVDELVADGLVLRTPDDSDGRARRIVLTTAGTAAMRDADRIKAKIEAAWRRRLGSAEFDRLAVLLRSVVDGPRDQGTGD